LLYRFVRPIWHALVTNRRDASWIEKGMAYVFITGIVNHFNYALFRLDESTAWSGMVYLYRPISVLISFFYHS